jgi:hypothetical protein
MAKTSSGAFASSSPFVIPSRFLFSGTCLRKTWSA